VEKCPDKTAKIVFEIKMKKLGEVEDPENDTSFIQSNQPFKKPSIKEKLPKEKTDKKAIEKSPLIKKPPEKSNTLKTTKENAKNGKDNDKNNSPANKSKQNLMNNSKKIPLNPKKDKKESSSEASESENSDDGSENSESNGSKSISGSGSASGSGSEEENKPKQRKTINILNNKNKKPPTLTNNNSKFLNNNDLNLSNIRSVKTVNSDDHLSQKIKSLLKDSNNGSKDSTKIEPNLRKLEMEEKKIALPGNFNKQEESDGDQMFAEFSAQKIKQLEMKLNAKTKENMENVQKIQDLEEELKQVNSF